MEINIRYGSNTPYDILSNLAFKPFKFRGVEALTIEGILQSLKVYSVEGQAEFWRMSGWDAKKAGRLINWWDSQILWWDEKPIDRHGPEYQDLLDELYGECYAQSEEFRFALEQIVKPNDVLTHTIGNVDPEKTILTQDEFLSRLHILRDIKKAP